jgi:hypothetical protein
VQKLREPPSWVKVQHIVLPEPAFVQSLAALHSCSCSVPEHVSPPSWVGHADAALHAPVTAPVVQLGAEPPVTGTDAQQTSPGQSEGAVHPELTPPLLLLLLPLPPPDPPLLPVPPLLLVLPPLPLPELLPPLLLPLLLSPPLLPLPLLLSPPLLPELPLFHPFPVLSPAPVGLAPPLHAANTSDAKTPVNRRIMGDLLVRTTPRRPLRRPCQREMPGASAPFVPNRRLESPGPETPVNSGRRLDRSRTTRFSRIRPASRGLARADANGGSLGTSPADGRTPCDDKSGYSPPR